MCRNSVHYFLLSLQHLWCSLLGTKNVYLHLCKFFGRSTNHGGRKDAIEITLCISSWNNKKLIHWVGCRKNYWNTMKHSYWNRESGNPKWTMLLVCKINYKQTVIVYSNSFKKHLNNTGTISLNIILQTHDVFAHWINWAAYFLCD